MSNTASNVSQKSGYFSFNLSSEVKAILWILLSFLISNINDVITKGLNSNLHPTVITFGRFLVATISILPFVMYNGGLKLLHTKRPALHCVRGILLYVSLLLWTTGLGYTNMAVATTLACTMPFFMLIFSYFMLSEKISWTKAITTIVGFVGILVITRPFEATQFSLMNLLILAAIVMFVLMDIFNKKYVAIENSWVMLFYPALVTMILAIGPAIIHFESLSQNDILLMIILGIGANFILYCIIKAFSYVEASFLAPFRYSELIMSVISGYIFFGETLSFNTLIGIAIIVPTSFVLIKYGNKK